MQQKAAGNSVAHKWFQNFGSSVKNLHHVALLITYNLEVAATSLESFVGPWYVTCICVRGATGQCGTGLHTPSPSPPRFSGFMSHVCGYVVRLLARTDIGTLEGLCSQGQHKDRRIRDMRARAFGIRTHDFCVRVQETMDWTDIVISKVVTGRRTILKAAVL